MYVFALDRDGRLAGYMSEKTAAKLYPRAKRSGWGLTVSSFLTVLNVRFI